jgi:hypothetical protein
MCRGLAAAAFLALSMRAAGAVAQVDSWDAIGPGRIGSAVEELAGLLPKQCRDPATLRCQLPGGTFAAVPVSGLEAVFQDARLAQVVVRFDTQHYPQLLAALRERWGEPEDRSFRTRAGMAGVFEAGVKLWPDRKVPAVLEEYAGKIDRGSLTFGEPGTMAPLIAAKRARPAGASSDL